jgi:hypothetical protein
MTDDRTAALLNEREKSHGDFAANAAAAQGLKNFQRRGQGRPLNYVQQEAIDVILTKIARIMVGDPNNSDHWADISGYARLVADDTLQRAAALKSTYVARQPCPPTIIYLGFGP